MRPTVNGVLLPDELLAASRDEQEAYAAKVKAGNSAFCVAVFALEDQAAKLGLTLSDLDDLSHWPALS